MTKKNIKTFAKLVAAVTAEQMQAHAASVANEFDDRMTFENVARPGNMSIQVKLVKSKARLTSLGMCANMIAADMNVNFVNRSLNEGKRFNVYAFDKLIDVLTGVGTSGLMRNAINVAILRSMIACETATVPFTGELAAASVSDKIKLKAEFAKLLTRHTVSAATAPTQTSSTMNALMVAGIVINTGLARMPVYQMTQTPAALRIREVLAA